MFFIVKKSVCGLFSLCRQFYTDTKINECMNNNATEVLKSIGKINWVCIENLKQLGKLWLK